MENLLERLLTVLEHVLKRINHMDANVQAVAAGVVVVKNKVDDALARVDKLSPADEATLATAKSELDAISAKLDAVLTPAPVTPPAPAA